MNEKIINVEDDLKKMSEAEAKAEGKKEKRMEYTDEEKADPNFVICQARTMALEKCNCRYPVKFGECPVCKSRPPIRLKCKRCGTEWNYQARPGSRPRPFICCPYCHTSVKTGIKVYAKGIIGGYS